MFRFMRPFKTALSVSRLPIRVAAQANRGEVYNLQGVRFQKKRLRPMALATTFLAVYVGYNVYAMIVLEPFAAALEEAFPTPLEDQNQKESPRIFIPFPGTTKLLPSQMYHPYDPVRQEYSKFESNPENLKRIQRELLTIVVLSLNRNEAVKTPAGEKVKLRRFWLDTSYPPYGPNTYTRSGIEITDDYISLVTEPVDNRTVFKINRLLWPSAMAKSVWAFIKVLVSEEAKEVARTLGVQGDNPLSFEEVLSKQVKLLSKGSPQTKESPATSNQPELLGDIQTQKSMVNAPENPSLANKKPVEKEADAYHENRVVSELSERLSRATTAFKLKLRQTWRRRLVPLNSDLGIVLSGLVEVETSQAVLVYDVIAMWDLKTKKYVLDSFFLRLKSKRYKPLQPKQHGEK